MKPKNSSGITYLDNLQAAWHANDLVDVEAISALLNKLKHVNMGLSNSLPVLFIIDYTEQRYLLMTDRITEISGYQPREFLETQLNKMMDVFHKDDFNILDNKIFASNSAVLNRTPFIRHRDHAFSYNFRFIGANKKYINVLQRTHYITSPETNLPLYSIGALTDITEFKTDDIIVHTVEKIDALGRSVIERNYFYPDEKDTILTQREKDVLCYITQGLGSKQIADRLRISENTVDNHRQNMLRKTNTKNIAELVAFAIRNRII